MYKNILNSVKTLGGDHKHIFIALISKNVTIVIQTNRYGYIDINLTANRVDFEELITKPNK